MNGSKETELIKSYLEFCRLKEGAIKTGKLDLSALTWIYPTTLLPLGEFIRSNRDTITVIPPKSKEVAAYISIMITEAPWSPPRGTYIPVIKIPAIQDELENALKGLYEKYKQGEVVGGQTTFKYVIAELTGNIYEHSQFTTAFVAAQAYPKKEYMEICFFDNGISIPGNFEEHKIAFPDDATAITEALSGQSTKDAERGKGLGTSIKLLTEALEGQVLIVSRSGLVYRDGDALQPFKLPESHRLKGTLIAAKIPFPSAKVDVYAYVE